jgi:hypothetical protein
MVRAAASALSAKEDAGAPVDATSASATPLRLSGGMVASVVASAAAFSPGVVTVALQT